MRRVGALIAIVFWGISFVATKTALRELSPGTIIFTRFAIGTAILLAILAFRRTPLLPPRSAWIPVALLGFLGIFLHQMLQAYGLTLTTAVNTGWLIGLTPIWSAIIAALVVREQFGPAKIAGLILGFAGALLVVTRGNLSGSVLGLPSTRGDLLILISTVNWAVYTVVGQPVIRRLGPTRTTGGAMLAGWLMLLPLFVVQRGWQEYRGLSATGWGCILFLGIGCSGLGYLFWYGALEHIEPSRVAAFLYLEPFITFVAAVILLGEPVRALTVIGGLLVLAGVIAVQRAPQAGAVPLPVDD